MTLRKVVNRSDFSFLIYKLGIKTCTLKQVLWQCHRGKHLSMVGQTVRNLPANARDIGDPRFDPWVRKIPWRREWIPTPACLPGESHGQRSLAGYSSWGCKELDMTERLSFSLFIVLKTLFSSVAQSCMTLCDPMDCSTLSFPVHHQLPGLAQIHVHWVSNVIQPSHALSCPSPPALNLF